MGAPKELRYTKEHEWVRIEGSIATVGITEFAQSELGDIVFVDLPAIGKACTKGDSFCVVESTKAASDVYSPISGSVKEVNTGLNNDPAKINSHPYEEGWLVKLEIKSAAEANALMDASAYDNYLSSK